MSPILVLTIFCTVAALPKTHGMLLVIKSEGEANIKYRHLMGVYKISDETLNNSPVYEQMYGTGLLHVDKTGLWVVEDSENWYEGYMPIRMYSQNQPSQHPPFNQWYYYLEEDWVYDPTLTVTPYQEPYCQDHSALKIHCSNWAKTGWCRKEYDYMTKYCKRSCGVCGEYSLGLPDYLLDQQSCAQVSTIPPHIAQRYRLDPDFYGEHIQGTNEGQVTAYTGKYTEAYGLPITSSKEVDDRALMRMCYSVRFLYASHRSIRKAAFEKGARFIVLGRNERTAQIPIYSYMDTEKRGWGWRVTMAPEENLLDFWTSQEWTSMDLGIHEVAHNFHLTGVQFGNPKLYKEIDKAYESAKEAGKYVLNDKPMYAISSYIEYFAEGATSYMGDSWSVVPPHNAEELKKYDPALYDIIKEAFQCNGPEKFIYIHNDIDQVLSRQSRIRINFPACELEPSSNIPPERDIKLKTPEEGAMYTWRRERCSLPFTYQGKIFEGCTPEKESWCPTHTEDGIFDESDGTKGWCYNNKKTKSKPCKGTESGKPCIFPFYYLGLMHVSCQGTGWCATEVDKGNNMTEWSTCDSNCYSRDENESLYSEAYSWENMSKRIEDKTQP